MRGEGWQRGTERAWPTPLAAWPRYRCLRASASACVPMPTAVARYFGTFELTRYVRKYFDSGDCVRAGWRRLRVQVSGFEYYYDGSRVYEVSTLRGEKMMKADEANACQT